MEQNVIVEIGIHFKYSFFVLKKICNFEHRYYDLEREN